MILLNSYRAACAMLFAVIALCALAGCRRADPPAVRSAAPESPRTHVVRPAVAPPPAVTIVHRCTDRSGAIAFQDSPCGAGATEVARTVVRHETEQQKQRARAALARAQQEAADMARVAHGPTPRAARRTDHPARSRRARCEQVRAMVKRERDATWMRITVDRMREHDAMIREACGADRYGG